MKFHWFNLMPWPHLPDDFRETNRSVWVDVDSRLYDPVEGHRVYHEYLDQLEYAAQLGFDGIGVNEHHQNAYGMMPSPQIMAATLSRRTQDVALLLLGQSIALYNPPTRVAEEMAMLDVMSGGRLIAGFPVGTSMDDNFCFGANPATLRDKYQENHDLILRAWADPEVFAWNGQYNKIRYVNIWPRPIQRPHPPIWIPGGGSIETWDFCAHNGYNYSYLSFNGYVRGEALMQGFWNRLGELGVEFNPFQGAFAQQIVVAETDDQAEQLYTEHLQYFFDKCLHVYPGFADAPGYRTENTIRAGLRAGGAQGLGVAHTLSWKDWVREGYIVAGSPASVTEQLETLANKLQVGHLVCLLHCGDMPDDKARASTKLMAEQVIPRLRHIWADYEDQWSPRPIAESQRATPQPLGAGS